MPGLRPIPTHRPPAPGINETCIPNGRLCNSTNLFCDTQFNQCKFKPGINIYTLGYGTRYNGPYPSDQLNSSFCSYGKMTVISPTNIKCGSL
jgi:hypothetical protein